MLRRGARPPLLTGVVIGFLIAAGPYVAGVRVGELAAGDPDTGHALFAAKGCGRCHRPRGERGAGPPVEELRRPQGVMELAGRLWNHVPGMFAALTEASFEWPRISVAEMSDLMAYLRADSARDPEPDLFRGHAVLIRKGCLKCHSLGQEGGPVSPDLGERRPEYESGATWAAAMWTHTPGMAEMAGRRGIRYPRFSGDEMGSLFAFLRHAAVPAAADRSPTAPRR